MAYPKWHIVPTAVIGGAYWFFHRPLKAWSRDTLVLLLIVGFGVLLDVDHLSIRRVKKLLRRDRSPIEGWVNWLHTWYALVGIVVVSAIIGNLLPLLSYSVHILIDGADRGNPIERNSLLPAAIHRFYPEWMTYDSEIPPRA